MDKYSLFAISVIAIVLLLSFSSCNDNIQDDDNDGMIGFADDIQKRDSGYVFYINDIDGKRIKAFYKEELDSSIHIFQGKFSDDGNIFFVNSISDY